MQKQEEHLKQENVDNHEIENDSKQNLSEDILKLIDTAPYQEIMNQNVNAPQEQKNLQNQEKTSEEQVLQKENNDGLIK